MDCQDYITVKAERKKGQHLGAEERGAIKVLVKQGLGIRAIAQSHRLRPFHCHKRAAARHAAPKEQQRENHPATPPQLGEAVYKANRVGLPEASQSEVLQSRSLFG
jgi:hypothetical protein